MQDDAKEVPAGATPGSEPWQMATLRNLSAALQRLSDQFDRSGVTPALRQSQAYDLHQIDPALTQQTLDDLLVTSEALATVTGPSALADGDAKRISAPAQGLAATWGMLQQHAGQTMLLPTSATQTMLVQMVLTLPPVQAEITQIITLLRALGSGTPATAGSTATARRRVTVPLFIIAAMLALIAFLVGSIAVATARIPPTRQAKSISINQTATSVALQTPNATSTTVPQAGATATPVPGTSTTPTPTATSVVPTSTTVPFVVTVAPSIIQLCPNADITLNYPQGGGALSWTATPSDTTNIGVHDVDGTPYASSVSGTLAPGQSIDVVVKALNDGAFSGTVRITFSGAATQYVSYYTNCLGSF